MPSYPTFAPPAYLTQALQDSNPLERLAQRAQEVDQRAQANRSQLQKAMEEWSLQPAPDFQIPKDPNAEYRAAMVRRMYAQFPQVPPQHIEDAVDAHMQTLGQ